MQSFSRLRNAMSVEVTDNKFRKLKFAGKKDLDAFSLSNELQTEEKRKNSVDESYGWLCQIDGDEDFIPICFLDSVPESNELTQITLLPQKPYFRRCRRTLRSKIREPSIFWRFIIIGN